MKENLIFATFKIVMLYLKNMANSQKLTIMKFYIIFLLKLFSPKNRYLILFAQIDLKNYLN